MTDAGSKGIWVGRHRQQICVRVVGRGTFQNSQPLQQFALEMIEQGHRDFVVDIGGCPGMDSTFVGVLAGIGLRLRQQGTPVNQMHVVNVNHRNCELLQTLGMDRLFCIEKPLEAAPSAGPLTDVPLEKLPDSASEGRARSLDKDETTNLMLDAHDNLVRADERNAPRFGGVTEMLRARADRRGGQPTVPARGSPTEKPSS